MIHQGLPDKRRDPLQEIQWTVSQKTYDQWWELMRELLDLPEGDPDVAEERQKLMEDVRCLPGFPHWADPDYHVIVPVVTSVSR